MLRRGALVITDVSEETGASINKAIRIGGLLAVTSNRRRLLATANVPRSPILVTLKIEALGSSETLALTRATWRNIQEGANIHSHHRENLKSYTALSILEIALAIYNYEDQF
jgi:hypothetical protein